eukprot:TRINITY_DN12649_c0_g3_i1.p1 TRINITY_DN12649_c0_g3~~TRINITY_DN12649_c0_g3_i1.p1  ORF type:complete len:1263 (-),score=243.51 TRINITY_DN12649_c0_g3_i1:178-3891(-)
MAAERPGGERRERKIGPYLLGNIIGKGGFGSVYKALDQQRGHFVAIKQVGSGNLAAGDIGSIEMEIALLSKLRHRNIVKYIDSLRMDQTLNIVLEYVEGGSLASILKKFGAFPETLCAIYTLQILNGLQYLHAQGVIHRDIKGANVLTTKKGLVKLADFGVATKLSEVDSSKRRVVGTPYWMAPEIVEMSPPTPACDIWSVGSTVVEMITEKPPYADLQQVSALYRIVSDPHPPVPEGVAQPLEQFLLLCFEKNPARRPSARELLGDNWITSNKTRTLEFTRTMMSPTSAENVAGGASPTGSHESASEDHMDGDDEADVADVLSIFVQTLTDNKMVQQAVPASNSGERDHHARRSSKDAKETTDGRPSSPPILEEQAVHLPADGLDEGALHGLQNEACAGASTVPALVLPPTTGSHGEAAVASSARGRSKSRELGMGFEMASNGAMSHDRNAAADVADEVGGEDAHVTNQYHFAFLDYYNKHCVGPSAQKAKPRNESQTRSGALFFPGEHPSAASGEGGTPRATPDATSLGDGPEAAGGPVRNATVTHSAGGSADVSAGGGGRAGETTPLPPPPRGEPLGVPLGNDWQREAAEIKQLLGSIRPFEEPAVLIHICKRLMELLQQGSSKEISNLITQQGAVPIVEMLQVTDPTLLRAVLRVINQIVEGNQNIQEIFAMVGLIPGVIKFAKPHYSWPLRYEAACFVSLLCDTSVRSLQMLVACGGLEALVDLVAHEYYHNRDLVWRGLDALTKVFESAPQNSQKRDFCRILAKRGLCGHLCLLIDTLASDIHEKASQYLTVVVDLLLFFAKEGDAVVKVYMAKAQVLEGLVAALEFLPPGLQVQICRTFKNLAQEPSVLNMLENAGIVPVLVQILSQHCDASPKSGGAGSDPELIASAAEAPKDARTQCLLALFNLCKLSRPRQEQAALAGVAPHLRDLASRRNYLQVYAFVMFCDLTCASLATRRILWAEGGVEFLVANLSTENLQTYAFEALVGWLGMQEHRAGWCERLEGELLKNDEFLRRLLVLFSSKQSGIFMKILDPLIKLVRVSDRINKAIAANDDFFLELVRRLKIAHHFRESAIETEAATEVWEEAPLAALHVAVVKPDDTPVENPAQDGGAQHVVRRMVSEPAAQSSDDVRARSHLLRLLHTLCKAQSREHLEQTSRRYQLKPLVRHVRNEERRRGRVILCEIASQLLELLGDATIAPLPEEANEDSSPVKSRANTEAAAVLLHLAGHDF